MISRRSGCDDDLSAGDCHVLLPRHYNLWSQLEGEASEVLEVICDGYKVAELQVKQLEERGFSLSEKLDADKCCGALIAMEGGRLLNRRQDLFYDDGLCTQKLLEDTPLRVFKHVLAGLSLDQHVGNISRGLARCSDERFVSEKQVKRSMAVTWLLQVQTHARYAPVSRPLHARCRCASWSASSKRAA